MAKFTPTLGTYFVLPLWTAIALQVDVNPRPMSVSLVDADAHLHPKIQEFLKLLESAPAIGPYLQPLHTATGFGQTANASVERTLGKQSVTYLVYSDSKLYDSRLTAVRDTWATSVLAGAIHAIGDQPAPANFGLPVLETNCPAHSHWEGACCKYAEAVIQAHDLMMLDDDLQWAYFIDDDAYVRPDALADQLSAHDSVGNGQGVILDASNGCAPQTAKTCPAGMCGGGGYAASRLAVKTLVGGNPANFLREQMSNCGLCERWADLALSKLASSRSISLNQIEGLNGWRLTRKDFMQSLQGQPLVYHYIHSKAEMEFLHSLFGDNASTNASTIGNSGDSLVENGMECASFQTRTHCATSGFPWD